MNTANYIFGTSPYTIPSIKKIPVTYLFGDQDGYIRVKTSKEDKFGDILDSINNIRKLQSEMDAMEEAKHQIERDFMNSGRELQGLPPYTEDDDYENARDNEASWDGN